MEEHQRRSYSGRRITRSSWSLAVTTGSLMSIAECGSTRLVHNIIRRFVSAWTDSPGYPPDLYDHFHNPTCHASTSTSFLPTPHSSHPFVHSSHMAPHAPPYERPGPSVKVPPHALSVVSCPRCVSSYAHIFCSCSATRTFTFLLLLFFLIELGLIFLSACCISFLYLVASRLGHFLGPL